jgi:hypothetical protein
MNAVLLRASLCRFDLCILPLVAFEGLSRQIISNTPTKVNENKQSLNKDKDIIHILRALAARRGGMKGVPPPPHVLSNVLQWWKTSTDISDTKY